MTEFAWRQTRTQAAAVAAALVVIVVAATVAGRQGATLRLWLDILVIAVPGILGLFWGAPLVTGELESGTFRLAWTQSVTRTRWLAVRITVGGLASMTVAGLLGLAVTWWAGPMAPSTLQPSPPNLPNAWITASQILNSGGRPLTASELAATCPGLGSGRGGGGGIGIGGHVEAPQAVGTRLHDCVARIGTTFHQVVSYQPASRYWPLQWCELAVFTAAAVVLAGLSLWWIRRIA